MKISQEESENKMFSRKAKLPSCFFYFNFIFGGFRGRLEAAVCEFCHKWKGADLFTFVLQPACIDLDLDVFTSFKDPACVTAATAAYQGIELR